LAEVIEANTGAKVQKDVFHLKPGGGAKEG
jgi:hypothetical protein